MQFANNKIGHNNGEVLANVGNNKFLLELIVFILFYLIYYKYQYYSININTIL